MKLGILSAGVVAMLVLGVSALSAVALGSDVLGPANDAVETNMPSDAKEISGAPDALDEAGAWIPDLEDLAADEEAGEGLANAIQAIENAMSEIEADMPPEVQETSGVLGVLQGVIDLLSDMLA